jgi:hypothetical protein
MLTEMVVSPSAMARTTPFSTVATPVLLLLHIKVVAIASSGTTSAVNVTDSPGDKVTGLLSILTPMGRVMISELQVASTITEIHAAITG